jgi:hypothetical protein
MIPCARAETVGVSETLTSFSANQRAGNIPLDNPGSWPNETCDVDAKAFLEDRMRMWMWSQL